MGDHQIFLTAQQVPGPSGGVDQAEVVLQALAGPFQCGGECRNQDLEVHGLVDEWQSALGLLSGGLI